VHIVDWLTKKQLPKVAEIMRPIMFGGKAFCGYYGWGSAVKQGQTLLMETDLLAEIGLLREAERGIMAGRMLLGQGTFGGLKGTLRIRVVESGTMVGDYPIADGHSLIKRSLAELGRKNENVIDLENRRANQSYAFWQRIPWSPELEAELWPVIDDTLRSAAQDGLWDFSNGPSWDEKKFLLDGLDESTTDLMGRHPYIAQAWSDARADYLTRVATSVFIETLIRVAVPTTASTVALQGRWAVHRWPNDSNGSTQAVEADADQNEIDRVARMEVIQYTIASHRLMAKGCFGVVEDELLEGVDVVLSLDDIKMRVEALDGLAHGDVIELDTVVTFNQWFGAGSAVGVNPEWVKDLQGADFDGDLEFLMSLAKYPVLFDAIRGRVPGQTPKLEKSHSPLEMRPKMITNSMRNLVGFASNVASTTFAVADRVFLAKQMGLRDEAHLNEVLNWFIKVGTDGFKTMVDLFKVERSLSRFQGQLIKLLGKGAPWCRWPNDWAFARDVPDWLPDTVGEYRRLPDEKKDNNIPKSFDGTVGQILRLTLPSLRAAMPECGPVQINTLSTYRHWARPVPEHLADSIHQLQLEFNARVHRVVFEWPEDVQAFKEWWHNAVAQWMAEMDASAEAACNALWREAHSSRSGEATAASVFMVFPEQCKEIILHKPGYEKAKSECLVVGLDYAFNESPMHLVAEVEICEFEQIRQNKRLIRRVLVGNAPGQKDPNAPYPKGMLGMVEVTSVQPELGVYLAEFVRTGHGKAWHCKLS
ncbi:MAG TPA: hypothetical protein VMX14_00525, partial [Anaerolineae bacterium]|nr:hypothetical protein [Anaerolineae bacterium]